jgi:hypothetical protein
MMRIGLILSLSLMFIAGCKTSHAPIVAVMSKKPNLVFLGTVVSIGASPLPRSSANYIVTFNVDKIESGKFSGKAFSFRINSPAKSGLEIGKQYIVRATKTDRGYYVDQYQWMNRPRN